jgi:hypothetical protein
MNEPQKSISLPTAVLAALTGIVFFWTSISPPVGTQPLNKPAHLVMPTPSGETAYVETSTIQEIRGASQSVYDQVKNLKESQSVRLTEPSFVDCRAKTALENINGDILVTWKPIPKSVKRCTMFVSLGRENHSYTVVTEGNVKTERYIYRSVNGEPMIPSEIVRELHRISVRDFSLRVYTALEAARSTLTEQSFPINCKTTTTLRDARARIVTAWDRAPDKIASCVVTQNLNGDIIVIATGTSAASGVIYVQGKN